MGDPAINLNEPDNSRLIRALDAWRASRENPARAEDLANGVIATCGPGDDEARVVALRTLGWIQRIRFEHDRALATLDAAGALARRRRLHRRASEVLITRAGVHLERGETDRAERDLRAARRLLPDGGSAELENQFGVVAARRGDPTRATTHFRAATEAADAAADPVVEFMALNNLGLSLTSIGRCAEAVDTLERAERVARGVGAFAHGAAVQSLAVALAGAARLPEALAHFDRAAEVLRDSGWPAGEAHLERIEVLAGLRLMREADAAAQAAVDHLTSPGGAMLRADVHLAHARVLFASGRHSEAAAAAETARLLFVAQRRTALAAAALVARCRADIAGSTGADVDGAAVARAAKRLETSGWIEHAADARLCLADLAASHGRPSAERRALGRVVELTVDGPALLRLRGTVAAARLATSPAQVRSIARSGLVELGRFRASLPTPELRALASGHGRELATRGLRSALAEPGVDDVLEWIELGRMASSLVRAGAPRDEIVDASLAQLREIQVARSGADQQALVDLRSQEARLERRIQRRLRVLSPEVARIEVIPDRQRIEAALDRSEGLLSLVDLDGRLIAVAVRGGADPTRHDLGVSDWFRRTAEDITFGLRRVVRARTDATRAAAREGVERSIRALDDVLADRVGPVLDGCGHVVIAPTAALMAVPWSALGTFTRAVCSVSPSIGLWLNRRRPDHDGTSIVIACGPDLQAAQDEVAAVAARHRSAHLLRDPATNVGEVLRALDGSALAHLACHGRMRVDNPSFSSLRLSDGDLTLLDLERLERPPRILVLSACDVGATTTLPGEELRGFLSGALAAGTQAVVASSVPVPDRQTAVLMDAVHERIAAGAGVGEALRDGWMACGDGSPEAFVARHGFACFGVATATLAG